MEIKLNFNNLYKSIHISSNLKFLFIKIYFEFIVNKIDFNECNNLFFLNIIFNKNLYEIDDVSVY